MKNEPQPIIDDAGYDFEYLSQNRKTFLKWNGEYDAEAWCTFNQQYNEFINHKGKREFEFIEKVMLI